MILKASSPRDAGIGGLGKPSSLGGFDVAEITRSSLKNQQAAFLARRFGLPPSRSRLFAGLAFETGRHR